MLVLERYRIWMLHTITGPAAVELLLPEVDEAGARALVAYVRQAVVAMVAPASWNTRGGPGVIRVVGKTVIIQQTRAVHDEVLQFLRDLKKNESSEPEDATRGKSGRGNSSGGGFGGGGFF